MTETCRGKQSEESAGSVRADVDLNRDEVEVQEETTLEGL